MKYTQMYMYYKPLCQLRVILKMFKLSFNNVLYRHMFNYSNKTSYNIRKVSNRRQRTASCELCALGMGFGFWLKRFHARIKIFLGSEVFQPISGLLPRKLTSKIEKKKTPNKQNKTTWIQGGSCACNLFGDFVPFWLIFNAMISCNCGIYSSDMYIEILR